MELARVVKVKYSELFSFLRRLLKGHRPALKSENIGRVNCPKCGALKLFNLLRNFKLLKDFLGQPGVRKKKKICLSNLAFSFGSVAAFLFHFAFTTQESGHG